VGNGFWVTISANERIWKPHYLELLSGNFMNNVEKSLDLEFDRFQVYGNEFGRKNQDFLCSF
jgi:hypothetical protein